MGNNSLGDSLEPAEVEALNLLPSSNKFDAELTQLRDSVRRLTLLSVSVSLTELNNNTYNLLRLEREKLVIVLVTNVSRSVARHFTTLSYLSI